MAVPAIPGYWGNYSRMCRRRLTNMVLVIGVIWSFDIRTSLASPVVGEEWYKGRDSNHALILRRSLQDLEVADPHEKCFETTCNRVTHYCDEVIRSCASCEDDCHPGRISGDDETIKDCLKKCEWYYYINSLKDKLCSAPEATESNAGLSDPAGAELTDYQLFVIILAVVTVCFTTIIIILVGVFCCILKRSLAKPTVVHQEGAGHSSPIYKPQSLRPYSTTDSKRRQDLGDTDIKLLARCSEDCLSNRNVQQESVRNSSNTPSSISLASNSQGLNCCNNTYAGQDQRQSNSFHQNHTDSSTRHLVK